MNIGKFYIGLKGSLQVGFALFRVILHQPLLRDDIESIISLLQTHLLKPITLSQTNLPINDVVIQLQTMLGEKATISLTDRFKQYGHDDVFRLTGSDYHLMFSVWRHDIQEYGHVEVYDYSGCVENLFQQGGILKN